MSRAGYLLLGGASTRMGADKALLPWRGGTLAECVARELETACGSVTLVGPRERYSALPFRIIPDLVEPCGPVGGICTALADTSADFNLVVACDMPSLTADFLGTLLAAAEASGAACLAPLPPSGRPQPLCAVYHRRSLGAVREALARGVLAARKLLALLGAEQWPAGSDAWFANMNTPEEWADFNAQ